MELSKIFRNKTINVTNNIRKYFKTTIWENCGHLFQSATKASSTLTSVPPCFSGFYMDATAHFVDTQTLTMSEKQGSESKGLEE